MYRYISRTNNNLRNLPTSTSFLSALLLLLLLLLLMLVECWYLRISIDFPLRFSISVSLIWSSCSPLSIQWCFYLHWHPYFLHLSTQSTRLLSSTLCFSSALVLLTFSRWRWRFLSFCLVVKNFALTLDLVLPWSLRTLSHFSSWQQRHASYVSSVLLCSYTML